MLEEDTGELSVEEGGSADGNGRHKGLVAVFALGSGDVLWTPVCAAESKEGAEGRRGTPASSEDIVVLRGLLLLFCSISLYIFTESI
jgi:hypothetical protein